MQLQGNDHAIGWRWPLQHAINYTSTCSTRVTSWPWRCESGHGKNGAAVVLLYGCSFFWRGEGTAPSSERCPVFVVLDDRKDAWGYFLQKVGYRQSWLVHIVLLSYTQVWLTAVMSLGSWLCLKDLVRSSRDRCCAPFREMIFSGSLPGDVKWLEFMFFPLVGFMVHDQI